MYVDREDVMVNIEDVGGALDFVWIEKELSSGADGVIFVFSTNDSETLETVHYLIDKVNLLYPYNPPAMMLVGNKCDLTSKVSKDDGQSVADNYKMPYIEVSAKMKVQVDDVFFNIIRLI